MENDTSADNPLHKRLGMRPGVKGVVISPPDGEDNPLLPLPEGVTEVARIEDFTSKQERFDYVHYFARNRAELARVFPQLRDGLAPSGSLWISWIKQTSARRGGGLPGDLNENVVRRMGLTSGLVDVKVAAVDQDWSALRLVHRKH